MMCSPVCSLVESPPGLAVLPFFLKRILFVSDLSGLSEGDRQRGREGEREREEETEGERRREGEGGRGREREGERGREGGRERVMRGAQRGNGTVVSLDFWLSVEGDCVLWSS